MSISIQTRKSNFKPQNNETDNLDQDSLNRMNEALKTAENLNQLLNKGSPGSNQAKSYAQYKNSQQISQSGENTATTKFDKSPTLAIPKSPKSVTVRIFNPIEHLDSSDEDECTFHPKINANSGRLVQRHASSGDVNEALYRDAAERTNKTKEYQHTEKSTIDRKTDLSKIGSKSMRIVLKKLQDSLGSLIKNAETSEMPGQLNFEGLGTVLHRLGVFQNLEFTSNEADGEKSSLSINQAKVKPERLAKEIQFHENLWKICALASIELDHIPSDLVLRIIMTLVEDKTPKADSAIFLLEIMDAKLESLGLKGQNEKFAYLELQGQKKLWSFEKVVAEFRRLFEDKTAFMNTYSSPNVLKGKNTVQVDRQYQNSHRPKINNKSIAMDSRYFHETYLKKVPISESDIKDNNLHDRRQRLYKYHRYLKDKKSLQLEAKIDEELAACTFSPQVKNYKKFRAQNFVSNETNTEGRDGSYSPSKSGYFTQALSAIPAPNRHLLLYEVAKTYKEKLQQKTYSLKKKEEIEDLSYCTFKPKLNDNYEGSPSRHQDFYEGVPNGFKKTVERLNHGENLRVTKKIDLETIPRGENYEKNKAAESNPPTFITRPKIKRQDVLVYVDVSIGPGRTGRIGIHKGDNARSLAINFARTYSLNANMKESLEKLLQSYIDSYFAQVSARKQATEGTNGDEHVVDEEGSGEGEEEEEEEGDDENEEQDN